MINRENMKRAGSILLFAVLFWPMLVLAEGKPAITFEKGEHDFGSFAESLGMVTCTFTFTNTGDAPLLITNASASCGCTRPVFPKEPVAPGKSAEITVTFNPKGRPGAFRKNVYIYSNTEPSKTTLYIKGTVIPEEKKEHPEFAYTMGRIALKVRHLPFFEVYTDVPKKLSVEFVNNSHSPLALSFDRVPRHLSVKQIPESVAPGQIGLIEITYNASKAKDWGIRRDEFYIRFPGEANITPGNTISVSADIREDYSKMSSEQKERAPEALLSESRIDFETVQGTTPVEKVIKIQNNGKTNLQIRKISNESNVVTAEVSRMSVQSGKAVDLKITVYPAKTKSKVLNHRIFIITNDPDTPTLSIPVFARFE